MKLLTLALFLTTVIGTAGVIFPQTGPFRVRVGKERAVKDVDLKVKFVELLEDSRCPEGVNCIWAGVARIKVRLTRNGKAEEFELNTNQKDRSAILGGYEVKLSSLTPYPKSGATTPAAGYTAEFIVTKKAK